MKKDIKILCILSLTLIIISTATILIFGRTYTVKFNIKNNTNYTLSVENKNSAKIEILKQYQKDNLYIVKIKAKKPGFVILSLNNNEYSDISSIYVHKSKVITENNFFGKSRFCEVIPISLAIILIYSIYIIARRYKYSANKNLYQYKNIAYLGIIIFLLIFTLITIESIFNYNGLYDTIDDISTSVSYISFFLLPIAFITFILVTISNIRLIMKEGKSWKNLLGLLLGIFICITTIMPDHMYTFIMNTQLVDISNLNSPGPYIYDFIETFIYLTISYLECILIGTIILAIKAVKKKVPYNKDYIIILGCQIKKDGSLTPLLKGRVDRALDFRKEQLKQTNKDIIFIPSGGKGKDEIISEAEAIKNYLIEQGIDKKNIILENKSTNTYENIKYSYKLIDNKKANICFSTTNYHVLRAGLIATEQGINIDGIGSSTKAYFWINAFVREFVGTIYSEKKKHLIVFFAISIFLIIMIFISYFANNI